MSIQTHLRVGYDRKTYRRVKMAFAMSLLAAQILGEAVVLALHNKPWWTGLIIGFVLYMIYTKVADKLMEYSVANLMMNVDQVETGDSDNA